MKLGGMNRLGCKAISAETFSTVRCADRLELEEAKMRGNSRYGTNLVLAAATAASICFCGSASAQAGAYATPHTSWGAPDLQGFWTNASITKMSRPAGIDTLVITEAQAKKLEDGDLNNQRLAADQKPTDQSLGAPAQGGLQANGNYNAFWWDPGKKVAQINGEYRSSWIVEPSTGRIPYKNRPAARPPARPAAAEAAAAKPAAKGKAPAKIAAPKPVAKPAAAPLKPGEKAFVEPGPSYGNIGTSPLERAAAYAGPEVRGVGERCLIGFGNTGGPVMNNVLYNNAYEIVQAPNAVMILVEMNHDARIIPIVPDASKAVHKPNAIKPWLGDSVGWYEGDTLVVETKNVNPIQRGYIGAKGKLTERFTRVEDGAILYKFEVDDPDQYTQVWKGEMPMHTLSGGLYEYACHEGNYALTGILEGAREKQRRGELLETTAENE
jgi:hypothetical protein